MKRDTQHNNTQHIGTRYSVIMLSVKYKPCMLSVVMLNVVVPHDTASFSLITL